MRVYGDVHMLSHLNGAAHRADLTRLHDLEREVGGLRDTLRVTRARANDALSARDQRIRSLEKALQSRRAQTPDDLHGRDLGRRLEAARRAADRSELRAERAEERLAEREQRLDEAYQELSALRELLHETREELSLTERRLLDLLRPEDEAPRGSASVGLDGRRVLYLGGRPSLTPHVRALVERMDGQFVHHDGGLEDNRAALGESLAGVDMVFCPVDCVSHDACRRAKECCRRSGARFVPLRSASFSAFVAGLERMAPGSTRAPGAEAMQRN
jgi:hypothetical protein